MQSFAGKGCKKRSNIDFSATGIYRNPQLFIFFGPLLFLRGKFFSQLHQSVIWKGRVGRDVLVKYHCRQLFYDGSHLMRENFRVKYVSRLFFPQARQLEKKRVGEKESF